MYSFGGYFFFKSISNFCRKDKIINVFCCEKAVCLAGDVRGRPLFASQMYAGGKQQSTGLLRTDLSSPAAKQKSRYPNGYLLLSILGHMKQIRVCLTPVRGKAGAN